MPDVTDPAEERDVLKTNVPAEKLYRVEATLTPAGMSDKLIIDYGFFPFYLRCPQLPSAPIECGCKIVRSTAKLSGGNLIQKPLILKHPGNGTAVIEFGSEKILNLDSSPTQCASWMDKGRSNFQYDG